MPNYKGAWWPAGLPTCLPDCLPACPSSDLAAAYITISPKLQTGDTLTDGRETGPLNGTNRPAWLLRQSVASTVPVVATSFQRSLPVSQSVVQSVSRSVSQSVSQSEKSVREVSRCLQLRSRQKRSAVTGVPWQSAIVPCSNWPTIFGEFTGCRRQQLACCMTKRCDPTASKAPRPAVDWDCACSVTGSIVALTSTCWKLTRCQRTMLACCWPRNDTGASNAASWCTTSN